MTQFKFILHIVHDTLPTLSDTLYAISDTLHAINGSHIICAHERLGRRLAHREL